MKLVGIYMIEYNSFPFIVTTNADSSKIVYLLKILQNVMKIVYYLILFKVYIHQNQKKIDKVSFLIKYIILIFYHV